MTTDHDFREIRELRRVKAALLDREAALTQQAIEHARALIADYGMEYFHVFGGRTPVHLEDDARILAASQDKHQDAPPKYRDPATDETWSGFGRQPEWIAEWLADGGTLEMLLIDRPVSPYATDKNYVTDVVPK